MERVFLVSDAEDLAPLAAGLAEAGFAVEANELAWLEALGEAPPAPLLLDLAGRPPGGAIRHLLSEPARAAVLALVDPTAVRQFDVTLGFDDFAARVADAAEIAVRLRQAQWRRGGAVSGEVVRAGELLIDLANYRVSLDGAPVELTFREYELLRFLASNPDRVFTRETLLNRVWGYDFYGGARTVDVHVRRLRSKIEQGGRSYVETVRNVGYRFRAD